VPIEVRVDVAPTVQAVGISRRFGGVRALRNVDLTILPGERVALMGRNGAGKTTLIRVLATALRPQAGALWICGTDPVRQPTDARHMVGVLSHQTYLYAGLTARENLRFYARLYRLADAEARITTVLERVGLDQRADDRVGTLSRGLAQRASLARAILHEPRLLLLDEPETGLDDQAQRMLADLIDEWAALGRSLLLTSHRLDWAKALTDRLVVLDRGAIVQADSAALS